MSKRVDRLRGERAAMRKMHSRKCGTCTACCTELGVLEIDKPPREPCKHLTSKGCGIYEKRPNGCRSYHCLWRQGILTGAYRPDRIGIIFDVSNDQEDVIFARELRAGALVEHDADIQNLSQNLVIVRVRVRVGGEEDRTILGPPERVEAFLAIAKKKLPVVMHGEQDDFASEVKKWIGGTPWT